MQLRLSSTRQLAASLLIATCGSVAVAQPPGPLSEGLLPPQGIQQPSGQPADSNPIPFRPPPAAGRTDLELQTRLPRGNDSRTSAPSAAALAKARKYVDAEVSPEIELPVILGRPKILQLADTPTRVFLADDEIATTEVLDLQTGRQLAITGREIGSTVLALWFASPDAPGGEELISYLVSVSDDPGRSRRFEQLLEDLEVEINRAFPNSVVKLGYVGAEVLVRGKAKDIDEATQILRIVSRSLPTASTEEKVAALEGLGQEGLGPGTVAAAGFQTPLVPDPLNPLGGVINPFLLDPDRIEQAGGIDGITRGRTQTGANAAQINSRVVNMLEVAGVHQIQLQVTLAEVVRDAGRSLISEVGIGDSFSRPGSAKVDFTAIEGVGQFSLDSNKFFLQVDALKRLGLARSLAEPNLTSLNGQPANFLVGGQFPILESTSTVAAVNQNIRFVPFGVQLSVIPTVTDGDRIRLNLQATVSEQVGGGLGGGAGGGIGGGGGVNGQQNDPSQPPSLSTRSFQTTVELRSSESLAVAGLIRTSLVNNSVRVPYLGDIPVLGNLFSNNSTSYQEQELILVVTPQLVSPVPLGQRPALPGSDTFEPDDLQFFIHGELEGDVLEDYRSPVRGSLKRMKAFRHAEQKYILGMPGHSSGRPFTPATVVTEQLR